MDAAAETAAIVSLAGNRYERAPQRLFADDEAAYVDIPAPGARGGTAMAYVHPDLPDADRLCLSLAFDGLGGAQYVAARGGDGRWAVDFDPGAPEERGGALDLAVRRALGDPSDALEAVRPAMYRRALAIEADSHRYAVAEERVGPLERPDGCVVVDVGGAWTDLDVRVYGYGWPEGSLTHSALLIARRDHADLRRPGRWALDVIGAEASGVLPRALTDGESARWAEMLARVQAEIAPRLLEERRMGIAEADRALRASRQLARWREGDREAARHGLNVRDFAAFRERRDRDREDARTADL